MVVAVRNIRHAVQPSSAAKMKLTQPNSCRIAAPTTMNSARMTSAPTMPYVSSLCRSATGTPNAANTSRKTKTLSSDRLFSTR